MIPARDEAALVGRSVASVADQRYAGRFHIVLVDDGSSDDTAAVARAAAPPALLTIVRARPLPAGWTGKLWAIAEGIREAPFVPDFLLLADADIVHAPENLNMLAARMAEGYDLVSFMAMLSCRTPAERALIPAFVFFFFLLYPPAWIRSPRHSTAGAAGGCILIRRTTLEAAGGIEAIRAELIDDCALAAAVKRNGGRVWLGLSAGTRSVRPYTTFGEIGAMISRTAFHSAPAFPAPTARDDTRPAADTPAPALAGAFGAPASGHLRGLCLAAHVDCLPPRTALLPRRVVLGALASSDRLLLPGLYLPLCHCIPPWNRRPMEGQASGRPRQAGSGLTPPAGWAPRHRGFLR